MSLDLGSKHSRETCRGQRSHKNASLTVVSFVSGNQLWCLGRLISPSLALMAAGDDCAQLETYLHL
jgi:hypothetical protein